MGQSTLPDLLTRNFVVSVERTIRLAEYESLRLALAESFPGSVDRDEAYRSEKFFTTRTGKRSRPIDLQALGDLGAGCRTNSLPSLRLRPELRIRCYQDDKPERVSCTSDALIRLQVQ